METHTNLGISEDALWQAFERKDADYDGKFFVAVRTTRIYCRPSCPARPLRKNVVFFATPLAAEQAGFRACKRCHPKETLLPSDALAHRAAELIQQNGRARLGELGTLLGISPFHLQRVFTKVMGVSPLQFAKSQRNDAFKQHLKTNTVTTALYNAGYESPSSVYANGHLGMPPRIYQNGGNTMQIKYSIVPCALGRMLMAGTPRGICAIYFGDNDDALEHELMSEYPNAGIEKHVSSDFQIWVQSVVDYLEHKRTQTSLKQLPLDVQGTAFQARVWQALREIPEGQTRTYSDVAKAIGQPTAMRAVANACGANRVSIVIPCHRVVREGGASGGYRWGVARKTKLLELEKEVAGLI